MNSYAIHGSGDKRTYEALYPIPKEELVEGQQPNLWVYIYFFFIAKYCFLLYECSGILLLHFSYFQILDSVCGYKSMELCME